MVDEKMLLILPEPHERHLLLVSSKGRTQAFQIAEATALQSFEMDMGDATALSLMNDFETVVEELGKIHQPFDMSAEEKFGFLVRSFFRFAEKVR